MAVISVGLSIVRYTIGEVSRNRVVPCVFNRRYKLDGVGKYNHPSYAVIPRCFGLCRVYPSSQQNLPGLPVSGIWSYWNAVNSITVRRTTFLNVTKTSMTSNSVVQGEGVGPRCETAAVAAQTSSRSGRPPQNILTASRPFGVAQAAFHIPSLDGIRAVAF